MAKTKEAVVRCCLALVTADPRKNVGNILVRVNRLYIITAVSEEGVSYECIESGEVNFSPYFGNFKQLMWAAVESGELFKPKADQVARLLQIFIKFPDVRHKVVITESGAWADFKKL